MSGATRKIHSSVIRGASFGLTSGIITTLGLIVGLYSGTGSRQVVLGGILTIAVADALSDALGIHISEESDRRPQKHVWAATLWTFVAKFVFALQFALPVMLLELRTAVVISVVWGFILIGALSCMIARWQKTGALMVVLEHVGIAALVVAATHYIGILVSA